MKKKVFLIIILIALLIIIDQIVKIIVMNNLQGQSIDFAAIRLTYSKNTGIAFGMAKDNINTTILTGATVLITIIAFFIRQFKNMDMKTSIVLSMILSGGFGNFLDRICYGGVIDYLDISKLIPNFPIFNMADCLIIIGLILFVIFTFREFANVKRGIIKTF